MTDQKLKHIYTDGEYLRAHPKWHQEDSVWKAEHVLRMLEKNCLTPNSICEVGCGAGEILRQMQLKMPGSVQFDGFDISPQAFDLCQVKANERLNFHQKDLMESAEANYDLLLVMDVLEHVEDYIGFLRSLKSKAAFHVFHIPLDISILTVLRVSRIIQARKHDGHLHYFLKDTALEALQSCGFEIVDMFYTCGSIDMPPHRLSSRIMAMMRKAAFSINKDLAARALSGFSVMVLTR